LIPECPLEAGIAATACPGIRYSYVLIQAMPDMWVALSCETL